MNDTLARPPPYAAMALASALCLSAIAAACGDDDDDGAAGSAGSSGLAGASGGGSAGAPGGGGGSAGASGGGSAGASGGGAGASGGGAPSVVEAFCQAEADYNIRCQKEPDDSNACRALHACNLQIFLPALLERAGDCLGTAACDAEGGFCFDKAHDSFEGSEQQPFFDDCKAKAAACGPAPNVAQAEAQCGFLARAHQPALLDGALGACVESLCDPDAFNNCYGEAIGAIECPR